MITLVFILQVFSLEMIRWFEKRNKISWAITLVIAATMFYISSRNFYGVPGQPGLLAIIYHMTAYFFLALSLMIAAVRGKYRRFVLPSALATLIYGISDEIHQLFVLGRYFSVGDIFLDFVGISFAFLVYVILLEYRNGTRKFK